MAKVSFRGVIGLHVHSNPDLRRRAYDDFGLMEAGVRAIVIKSHQGSTVDRAYLCNRYNELIHRGENDFTMFGGITLNRQIGGINPWAVESCLRLGGKIVWLPTASARNHMVQMGQAPDSCVEVVRDGKVVPELKEVFRLVRDFDVILATSHISPEECFTIVEAARAEGVRKIIVTHPEWRIVGMSLDDQLRLVKDYGVYLERCFAQNMGGGVYKSNLAGNLEAIRVCGYRNIIISTDGGQVENPHWEIALEQYIQYLADHGIPADQLYRMTHSIQAALLGLEESPRHYKLKKEIHYGSSCWFYHDHRDRGIAAQRQDVAYRCSDGHSPVAALILGFGPIEVAGFIKDGIGTTTSNGILFIFSVIYFGVMSDTGMFDVIVNGLVKVAGKSVIAVTVATAIIATIAHMDGTTATPVLITIPAMYPVYKRMNIDTRSVF